MLRRALFAASFLLLVAGVLGAVLAESGVPRWVVVVTLVGVAIFAAAVALALREIMRGLWRVSKAQSTQSARVAAMSAKVQQQTDSLTSLEVANTAQVTAALQQVLTATEAVKRDQTEQIGALKKADGVLKRIESRQAVHETEIAEVAKSVRQAVKRIERGRNKDVVEALKRIERISAEKLRPAVRSIERELEAGYRQTEAQVSLLTALDLVAPLPPLRGTWAVSPDAAAFLVRLVFEQTPETVLDIGSGVSTVIVARALQIIGSGRIRSLEQDPEFLAKTAGLLRSNGLEQSVELKEAGIQPVMIDDVSWPWYSPKALEGLDTIDLVIVDGPPGRTGKQARYPALPMVADLLSEGALIFLDDASREDEQSVVARWLDEYPLVERDVPNLEKGAALLEWRP